MVKIKEIYFRKGGRNKKFRNIVKNITNCLKRVNSKSKTFDRHLLTCLRRTNKNYINKTEVPIFRKLGYQIDIYNPKEQIAIEIEKSETKLVWRILCKFIIGARRRKINYAVLIVPIQYKGTRKNKTLTNIFNDAKRASHFLADILWVKNIAIIGYEKY